MQKAVFLDFGVFMHRSIFASVHNPKIPPTYTAMNMILSCLNRIELSVEDTIILACDSPKGSWRKEIDVNYKANRRANREKSSINWKKHFSDFDELIDNIKHTTPFRVIKIDKLEADDIIAYGVKYYNNMECVIVSSDSDYEQLTQFPNVKIFSPISKKYKIVKNPYSLIGKKIKKEASDNLVTPILNQIDYDRRNSIVNLAQLPKEVEQKIDIELRKLDEVQYYNSSEHRFRSIGVRIQNIYDNDPKKIVTMEDSLKKKKKRKKKIKENV